MFNIILLGPPGSGKGTQAARLVQKYRLAPLGIGVLLRKEITDNGPNKPLIEQYIHNGQLVPDALTYALIAKQMADKAPDQFLLFDGFPRTVAQADFLENLLKQHSIQIDCAIFFDVPYAILLQRLQQRALIEGREDDQDECSIHTRMRIYEKETLPMIDHFQFQGKLHRVDGTLPPEEVEKAIDAILAFIRQ